MSPSGAARHSVPTPGAPTPGEGAGSEGCAHCGLPCGTSAFCCYGCELARDLARESEEDGHRRAGLLTLSLLLSMVVMMLSLFLYAEDIYEATNDPFFAWLRGVYRGASALLATPVVLLLGVPLGKSALHRLRHGEVSMELLVLVGASAAWLASLWSLWRGGSAIYFDSAVAALVLATFGRYLEARARQHASRVVGHLVVPDARPVRAGFEGEPLSPRSPAAIEPGMILVVPADGMVPVDARLTSDAEVSLGVLTGEAEPVTLAAGEEVPAGATPIGGDLEAVALRPAKASTLERLSDMARSLREERAAVQRLADRLAAALTPLVAVAALGALAYWSQQVDLMRGIDVALAVVLVACPCTYGVITPLVLWLTLRRGLAEGVVFRRAAAVEAMAATDVVAFDKTGTLTTPIAVARLERYDGGDDDLRPLIVALEGELRHPLAKALSSWAGEVEAAELSERRVVAGGGVRGRDGEGRALALGSAAFLEELGIDPRGAASRSVLLARDGELVASFAIDEALRPEAKEALDALTHQGKKALVLTGDRAGRAAMVAAELGLEARAELRPEDKVTALRDHGQAAFVGDGLNDAPVTAAAAVSIAVAGASGLNRGLADVTLLRDDLRLIPWAFALASRARRLAARTLAAATIYNLFFVALAAAGVLRPIWAGVSMLIASMLSLASALTLAGHPGPALVEAASETKPTAAIPEVELEAAA